MAIKAVGLNFRDVLNVLGMYPGDPGDPGADCSGVVMQVGAGVNHHLPGKTHLFAAVICQLYTACCILVLLKCTALPAGDSVFGYAPGCIGYSACTNATVMALKPTAISYEEAATVPTVFLTVLAAFGEGIQNQRHARVLVHAGTGGVGLTAVNVAQALGWHVATTASNAGKRNYLRRIGIAVAAESRNISFVDQLTPTAGCFDFVLNSLTSPGAVHSFTT